MKTTPAKLQRLLQRLFASQAREVASKISLDRDPPDMSHWVAVTAEACQPLMLATWQQGMAQAAARISRKRDGAGEHPAARDRRLIQVKSAGDKLKWSKNNEGGWVDSTGRYGIFPHGSVGWRLYNMFGGTQLCEKPTIAACKSWAEMEEETRRRINKQVEPRGKELVATALIATLTERSYAQPPSLVLKNRRHVICKAKQPDMDFSFDLFNPRVLDAVDQATYTFCRDTMATATDSLKASLDKLRQLMRTGLSRGDAIQLLAREIRTIFADPMRAFRIATTETSRAVHGGGSMAALEAGVTRHSWLASVDACDRPAGKVGGMYCQELNGKTVKIGEPFWINPRGGPYAVCLYPPLHPTCFCTTTEELD